MFGKEPLQRRLFSDFSRLSSGDQRRVVRAFGLLDRDEHAPGLDLHPLHGDLSGIWAARASKSLRLTFQRLADGRKLLIGCSQH